MAHEAPSYTFNDYFHAALDSVAVLPLIFIALLSLFVVAAVVLENGPHQTMTMEGREIG